MHENNVGFEAVCYQPLMFMMELVVLDFNVFGTDKKLTTLEELLHYWAIFKKVRHLVSGMFGKILTSMGIFFLYAIFLN